MYVPPRLGMSEADNGALVQIVPLLRRTLPVAPDEFTPAPPLAWARTPVIFPAPTVNEPLRAPFTVRLPPIVPLPEMLKLLNAWVLVPF